MLLLGLKYALLLAITACFLVPIHGSGSDTDQVLPHRIYRLLDRLSGGRRLSASSTFALLLSQFLIKREPNEPYTCDTDDGCAYLFMPRALQRNCATWRLRVTNVSSTTICCTGWNTSEGDRVWFPGSMVSRGRVCLLQN